MNSLGKRSLSQITPAISSIPNGETRIIGREGNIRADDMPTTVSRQHVSIKRIDATTFEITNISTTSRVYILNSTGAVAQELANGEKATLTSGTVIKFGGYPILIPFRNQNDPGFVLSQNLFFGKYILHLQFLCISAKHPHFKKAA